MSHVFYIYIDIIYGNFHDPNMQTHWVQGDDPGGRPGRPAGEPGRRELSAGAPGRAGPSGEREVVACHLGPSG